MIIFLYVNFLDKRFSLKRYYSCREMIYESFFFFAVFWVGLYTLPLIFWINNNIKDKDVCRILYVKLNNEN